MGEPCLRCGSVKGFSRRYSGAICEECWISDNAERWEAAVEAWMDPAKIPSERVCGIATDNLLGMTEFLVKCLSTDFGQKSTVRVYGSAEYTPEVSEITERVIVRHKDLVSFDIKKIVDDVATAAVRLRDRTAKTLGGCENVEYCGDSVFGARVWVNDSFEACVGLWAYVAGIMPDGTRVTEEKV